MKKYNNKYKLKEKTIQVKIPIEVDDYLKEFIFKNINMYRHIKNDFIDYANKYKEEHGSYIGCNVLNFKTKYFEYEEDIGRYEEYSVGLSEQVAKDVNTTIKMLRTNYKKSRDRGEEAKEGTLHFRKLDRFYGSFKVHNKPSIDKRHNTKRCCSRLNIVDKNHIIFRVRANMKNRKAEYLNITLKEPLCDEIIYDNKDNHMFIKYYTEGTSKHEYRFNSIDIKETCFIHELARFYIQFSIDVIYIIDTNEVEDRLPKAGIDTGIHNPAMIYDGNHYIRVAMDDKTSNKIHYLERRARRIQNHMDNKYRINKERMEKGEIDNPYSNNFIKLQRKFRKIWRRIRNIRRHWRYVTCKKIVTRYKKIVVDTFEQPRGFKDNLPIKLKKLINYNNRFHCMYTFNETLKHIADKYGCEYIEAPEKTTCTCSICGYVNKHLPLKERNLTCKECGEVIDRDMNAAKSCYLFG